MLCLLIAKPFARISAQLMFIFAIVKLMVSQFLVETKAKRQRSIHHGTVKPSL